MKRSGFTIIELILAVSLLAGLSILTTGWYSRFLTQNAVNTTADLIAGSLRKAQAYAASGKGSSNWGVAYTAPTITLYKGSDFASRSQAVDEPISVNSNIIVSGLTDINFSRPSGLPSTTATIIVTGNSTVKSITVNSQGRISQ